MGLKLLSKANVMSMSGVLNRDGSKKIMGVQRTFSNWNLLNMLTCFTLSKRSVYIFIKENVAINIITNIKLIFLKKILGSYFYLRLKFSLYYMS